MPSLRTIGVRLRMETGQYKRDAAEATGATDTLKKKISETGSKSKADLDKIALGMGLVGTALLGVAGAAVIAAASFDKQMSEVQAVTGATVDTMGELRTAAIVAGQATVFSAGEAAKAEAELAKAGISTADILGGALRGALDLAAAGSLDLADAAVIAANAMNTFNLSGEDVSHIADVLAAAANKSAANVHDLGLGLQQVGLVANQVGFSLEETVGLLAAFADRGLRGSDGATSLKTALQRLAAPTDKAADLMQELGISMYDSQGQMLGAADVAGQLQNALKDLTPAQRNAALQTMFGSDAIRAANILYSEGTTGIQGYIDAVNDQGAASDMAATKLDNLAGDLEQLRGSLETLAIGAGSGAGGGLRPVVKTLTELVNQIGALPGPVQTGVVAFTGLAGAALLAGAGMLKLKTTLAPALSNLAATGPAGARTAGALGAISKWAARATVALAGFEIAMAAINAAHKDLNAQLDAAALGFQQFAESGKFAGEAARIFGENGEDLSRAISSIANSGFSQTMDKITGSLGINAGALQDNKERVQALDTLLADMVKSGHAEEAFAIVQRAALEANTPVDNLRGVLNQYTAALETTAAGATNAADATGKATATTDILKDTLDETTAAADGLTEAWDRLHGAVMSADESMLAAKKAVDDVAASFEKNGDKIKGNSKAALENRIALEHAGAAATAAAQDYFNLTGDLEGAEKIMRDQQKAAEKAAVANGGNAKEVHNLSSELFKVPKLVSTKVQLTGVSAALNTYYSMRGIISQTITVPVRTVQTGPIAAIRRWGGITEHADQGLLRGAQTFTPVAPARYAFAEPQTGGEAFVPKRGNYGRSMSILSAAAGWYNADVVPRGGWYGGGAMGGSGQVNVVLPPGGTPFERALVEVLRGLSWSTGGGSAQKSYGRSR